MGKLVKISAALVAAMVCFFAFVGCDDPAAEPTNNENAGTIETYDRNEWQIENSAVVKYLGTATDVTIPNGVTYIMSYAFEDCHNLKSLAIPASVMGFGEYTFAWCDLEIVNYGGTLAQWCTMDRSMGCTIDAQSVKLSDGTDLKRVTTLVIPDGVTHIGSYTFDGYDKLTSVTIPASVREIGYYAFDSRGGLTTIHYTGTLAQWCAMNNCYGLMQGITSIRLSDGTDLKSITTLDIPEGVTSIGYSAFYGCDKLTSITIPVSVKGIGYYAFEDCNNLTNVQYGGAESDWKKIEKGDDGGLRGKTITGSDGSTWVAE